MDIGGEIFWVNNKRGTVQLQKFKDQMDKEILDKAIFVNDLRQFIVKNIGDVADPYAWTLDKHGNKFVKLGPLEAVKGV